jgi:hypothetical protein
MRRGYIMPRVEKCTIINPPVTAEEQEALKRKITRALAVALFRSFEREKNRRDEEK